MLESGGLHETRRPLMTFRVADEWIAVAVEQVETVTLAPRLWPVPRASADHRGLFDVNGALVPVLSLGLHPDQTPTPEVETLVAILQVRGESIGLEIDQPGQVFENYSLGEDETPPEILAPLSPQRGSSRESRFWLVDADQLWRRKTTPSSSGDQQ